jgi:hypothetical protein
MEGTSGGAGQNRSDVKSFASFTPDPLTPAIETIVSGALNFVRFRPRFTPSLTMVRCPVILSHHKKDPTS